MSCQTCGREGGHFLGCGATGRPAFDPKANAAAALAILTDQCGRDGCTNDRAPQGKGPRPKYCIEHKTGSKK